MHRVWFITGAGRGFGKEFAKAALGQGDQVAATVRNLDAVQELTAQFGEAILPLQLDVTDRDACFAAVAAAKDRFGRIDVVVNNAGYGLFGTVEEISPDELRQQLEVNLFGVLHVTQAVLPILRAQGSGHIIQISTIGGIVAFPNLGGYHASKWALEGLTESLAAEVAPFGIKITLVEPGGFATDWASSSAVHAAPQPQYDGIRAAMAERRKTFDPAMTGNPAAVGAAILSVVNAEQPPARVFFGKMPLTLAENAYESRLATWREWQPVAEAAHGA